MGGFRRQTERVDLSEDARFFLDLKREPQAWRERVVSELRFGNRSHIYCVSGYQVDFPPALLKGFLKRRDARIANVLLPLTTREKRPLLNLGVTGPGGSPATVTARASIAALQTHYLVSLAAESSARSALSSLVEERLWEAICMFSPSFFASTYLDRTDGAMVLALSQFLSSGLGFEIDEAAVRGWRAKTMAAGQILASRLLEPPSRLSSSEEMLLAIPNMSPLPTSIREIDQIVDRFHLAVATAHRNADDLLLTTLAEYGRRYELIVEVEVPLLEPCRIKVEEELPLTLYRRRTQYWVEQTFALGDARSAHFEARVDDPSVEMTHEHEVHDCLGNDSSGWLEAVRSTREALAIYTSEPGRPHLVRIAIRLRVASHLMAATQILVVVNVVAVALALLMGSDEELASRLAVLVLPTTIAATFVLIREQTALATRLQAVPRVALALSALLLWIVVSLQLVITDSTEKVEPVGRPANAPHLSRGTPPRE
jgi:hypothetical protein